MKRMKILLNQMGLSKISLVYFLYKKYRVWNRLSKKIFDVTTNGVMVSDTYRYVYFPIAKCGCSTVKKFLWKLENESKDISDQEIHLEINDSALFLKKMPSKGCDEYYKFAFVRNPLERFVSFYKDKFEKSRVNPIHFESLGKFYPGQLSPDMSFDDVVDFCVNIPDEISDIHFKSQRASLSQYGGEVKNIYKLENFDRDFPKVLKTILIKRDNDIFYERINKLPDYDYRSYYNKDSVRKVFMRYAGDMIYYDYIEEYEALLRNIDDRNDVSWEDRND